MKTIDLKHPSRRTFLKTLGAGLLIAVASPEGFSQEAPAGRGGRRGGGGAPASLAARLHIGKDGQITVMTGKVECGQGARAEITQAAAEELRVSMDKIQLIMADTSLVPDDGGTFGSQTTPRTIPQIRQAAASALQILLGIAAAQWSVPIAHLHVENGNIIHAPSGRTVGYGDLVGDDSAKVLSSTRPMGVIVTPVNQWKVLGSPVTRNDARDLVDGKHQYPSDIVRSGMLYGKVLHPPTRGATLTKIDLAPAQAINGVSVVHDGDFVGVAAPNFFLAGQAIDALAKTAEWKLVPRISTPKLYETLSLTARNVPDNPFGEDLKREHQVIRQAYNVAYVQHAPMEPRAAVADWQDGKITVWTGTQNPFAVRTEIQQALGLESPESVRLIVPDFGGGFGGKHTGEAAVEAARLSKAIGKPVWIRWTRNAEFTNAYFRPAGVIIAEAGLNTQGDIMSWYFMNINSGPAAVNTPYHITLNHCVSVQADEPLRQGSYRGLAATANHFARESFMDELCFAAKNDPLTFRLNHLQDDRLTAVLKTAAKEFDFAGRWKIKDPRIGVGIACGTEKGSYICTCAEVEVDQKLNTILVRNVCQAYECGKIVNPQNLLSQVQGAIMMGIGPALREEIEFDNGQVTNGSFADYKVPRFADVPAIDVHLMDRQDLPSAGAGETPIVCIAPAIANAVFHATGIRVRQMPIRLETGVEMKSS